MARNRRKRRHRTADSYSQMDELLASTTHSLPIADIDSRVAAATAQLTDLLDPETATVTAWSFVCMVGNVLETMIAKGLAEDPQGLLADAQAALRRATEAYAEGRGAIVLDRPADIIALRDMITDWAACMRGCSARAVIHCFRATDRRVREIEAGRPQAHDFTIRTAA